MSEDFRARLVAHAGTSLDRAGRAPTGAATKRNPVPAAFRARAADLG